MQTAADAGVERDLFAGFSAGVVGSGEDTGRTGAGALIRYRTTIGSDRPCNQRAASVSRNVIRISSTLYADAVPNA